MITPRKSKSKGSAAERALRAVRDSAKLPRKEKQDDLAILAEGIMGTIKPITDESYALKETTPIRTAIHVALGYDKRGTGWNGYIPEAHEPRVQAILAAIKPYLKD